MAKEGISRAGVAGDSSSKAATVHILYTEKLEGEEERSVVCEGLVIITAAQTRQQALAQAQVERLRLKNARNQMHTHLRSSSVAPSLLTSIATPQAILPGNTAINSISASTVLLSWVPRPTIPPSSAPFTRRNKLSSRCLHLCSVNSDRKNQNQNPQILGFLEAPGPRSGTESKSKKKKIEKKINKNSIKVHLLPQTVTPLYIDTEAKLL
ncbi:hypothetical protein NE237_011966 [Protea cynaroides]|uniref:Uncharacterized protein n=1 Tax=Protea cynaroides TaxID=273540 RepID=A0A9Q0GWN1_9MAGN|nr:hypothetical protein NE237_011966 [Protea cynaroides]